MPRAVPDVSTLAAGVLAGDRSRLARAITLVESTRPDDREAAQRLLMDVLPHAGGAHRVGVSGVPGVGKSTFIEALGMRLIDAGQRVAVLAVDPSSSRFGGSILGDKTRMERLARAPTAFIRPTPSQTALGGVGRRTREAILVAEAWGAEVVLVETVGVGQSEVDVAGLADTTLVLLAPGMGDGIQAAKAGILEIGDVYVVNKADRDGATQLARDLRGMLALAQRADGAWRPPIVKTVAVKGDGLDALVEAIDRHHDWAEESGELAGRRLRRARDEIEAIALTALRARFVDLHGHADLDRLAAEVIAGDTDPYAAADRVVATL